MILLPRRSTLAVAAVLDIALHARPAPVSAKALAARHDLPPRQLEPILQALVRSGILKGTRGPRGGYELGGDRRRITVGDIVRATRPEAPKAIGQPGLVERVVEPAIAGAGEGFLRALDRITVEDLCRRAGPAAITPHAGDFTI